MLNYKDIIHYFQSGCKARKAFRYGLEWEQFTYDKQTNKPLPYSGNVSVHALLTYFIDHFGWSPLYEKEAIIALKRQDPISHNTQTLSLEPGGQLELSGALQTTVKAVQKELTDYHLMLQSAEKALNIGFKAEGLAHDWSLDDFHLMPKQRYAIMSNYMPKVGNLGLHMMFRTCTMQMNMDYASEQDMIHKMRVSMALQPLATALFVNSPHEGYPSYRAYIWTDTDPDRTGFLDFIWQDDFGFESYAHYLLKMPMYFIKRGDHYHDCTGYSFQDFLDGKLSSITTETPTLQDFEDHAGTAFPEVRLKNFLEMRGSDTVPFDRVMDYVHFWDSILYNESHLMKLYEEIINWSPEAIKKMHHDVLKDGMKAKTPTNEGLEDFYKRVFCSINKIG